MAIEHPYTRQQIVVMLALLICLNLSYHWRLHSLDFSLKSFTSYKKKLESVIPVLGWSKIKVKLSGLQRQKPTVHSLEKEIEENNPVTYIWVRMRIKKYSAQLNSISHGWKKIIKFSEEGSFRLKTENYHVDLLECA